MCRGMRKNTTERQVGPLNRYTSRKPVKGEIEEALFLLDHPANAGLTEPTLQGEQGRLGQPRVRGMIEKEKGFLYLAFHRLPARVPVKRSHLSLRGIFPHTPAHHGSAAAQLLPVPTG